MRKRMLGILTTATTVTAFAGLAGSTTPAAAADQVVPEAVRSIGIPRPPLSKYTPAGTIQLLHRAVEEPPHVRMRVLDPKPDYSFIVELDLDGDRIVDMWSVISTPSDGETVELGPYPMPTDGDRAIRACLTKRSSCAKTHDAYRTAWWEAPSSPLYGVTRHRDR